MTGRVVSVKNQKTAVVLVASIKVHPLYNKSYKTSKRYQVHDEEGVKLGDIVEFIKTAPISKHKHWKITKVIGKDIVAMGTQDLKEKAQEAIEEVLPEEEKKEQLKEEIKAVEAGKESK